MCLHTVFCYFLFILFVPCKQKIVPVVYVKYFCMDVPVVCVCVTVCERAIVDCFCFFSLLLLFLFLFG